MDDNFHPDDFASIERVTGGGWQALASGSAGKMLSELAQGLHGAPGALSLLIEDTEYRVTGRALTALVARCRQ